jgi:prepilin-type processing-associated H-X9-DG protein
VKLRSPFKNWSRESKQKAFTFTELLVVTLTIVLLALVFLPAHAASRPKSQSVRCMDNLRQIMSAIMMYTHDNRDLFPPNPDDGNAIPGHNWCPGIAAVGGVGQFNPDILADPSLCLITTYINTNVSLFRCPSDLRVGIYQGTDPAKLGTKVPAARSIAMNGAVGTCCSSWVNGGGHANGVPFVAVNGPWLDNNHTHIRNRPWRTYGKVSDTIIPGAARLWVIIEEDAYSINDGVVAVGMNIAEWIDWPGTRHAMSCSVAFADGHVELHKWVNPTTRLIGSASRRSAGPDTTDWLWLTERTSARAQ